MLGNFSKAAVQFDASPGKLCYLQVTAVPNSEMDLRNFHS